MDRALEFAFDVTQLANGGSIMDVHRGVMSGMLNLSRNLGLITGAPVMGAVFTLASATSDITTARPEAVAAGMRITSAVAAMPIVVALAIAVGSYALATCPARPGDEHDGATRLLLRTKRTAEWRSALQR